MGSDEMLLMLIKERDVDVCLMHRKVRGQTRWPGGELFQWVASSREASPEAQGPRLPDRLFCLNLPKEKAHCLGLSLWSEFWFCHL